MDTITTYLSSLQNKVFKLLPMREAYDNGANNHMYDYMNNLIINCSGASTIYPQLKAESKFIEVQTNIAFLINNQVDFLRWRSIVLRSTRLVHSLYVTYKPDQEA